MEDSGDSLHPVAKVQKSAFLHSGLRLRVYPLHAIPDSDEVELYSSGEEWKAFEKQLKIVGNGIASAFSVAFKSFSDAGKRLDITQGTFGPTPASTGTHISGRRTGRSNVGKMPGKMVISQRDFSILVSVHGLGWTYERFEMPDTLPALPKLTGLLSKPREKGNARQHGPDRGDPFKRRGK